MDSANVFDRLYYVAGRGKRWEDFLTEGLAYVLELMDSDRRLRNMLPTFINSISSGDPLFKRTDISSLRIRTQVVTPFGRPDLIIDSKSFELVIEVKDGSRASHPQLDKYSKYLSGVDKDRKGLVLLTRFRDDIVDHRDDIPSLRWYQVLQALDRVLKEPMAPETRDQIAQFAEFLDDQGIGMRRITKESLSGLSSTLDMIEMLKEIVHGLKDSKQVKLVQDLDYIGFEFHLWKSQTNYLGFHVNNPYELLFEAEGIPEKSQNRVDQEGPGEMVDGLWQMKLDLRKERFFTRSLDNQLESLETFVREGISTQAALSKRARKAA